MLFCDVSTYYTSSLWIIELILAGIQGTVLSVVPPRIVERVSRQEVLVGATIQLRCVAEGTAPITWQWKNNTNLVMGDDRVTVDNGQLTISNAQVSDSGVYQCVASHVTSGQDGASNTVIVTSE